MNQSATLILNYGPLFFPISFHCFPLEFVSVVLHCSSSFHLMFSCLSSSGHSGLSASSFPWPLAVASLYSPFKGLGFNPGSIKPEPLTKKRNLKHHPINTIPNHMLLANHLAQTCCWFHVLNRPNLHHSIPHHMTSLSRISKRRRREKLLKKPHHFLYYILFLLMHIAMVILYLIHPISLLSILILIIIIRIK